MSLRQITPPVGEPISLTEAKAHLRATDALEDALIDVWITASRQWAEAYTGRAFLTQVWEWTLERFAQCLYVPLPPLQSVVSVKYNDAAGVEQTLSSTIYTVDNRSQPGRLVEAYQQVYPVTRQHVNDVTVRFKAGYATPFTVNASTELITALNHPYANDDTVRLTNSGGALPAGLAVNTDYYVVQVSGNTLKLSATQGGAAIDITDTGTGTHFLGEVPRVLRAGMLLIIADLFEQRGHSIVGAPIVEVPFSARVLLDTAKVYYRVGNV